MTDPNAYLHPNDPARVEPPTCTECGEAIEDFRPGLCGLCELRIELECDAPASIANAIDDLIEEIEFLAFGMGDYKGIKFTHHQFAAELRDLLRKRRLP